MVLTSFPTDQGRGKVRARITAHTICPPHGFLEAGRVLDLEYRDFLVLKENGKAERVEAPEPPQQPVSEQLGGGDPGDAEQFVEESVFRAALEKKTKAEIVALAESEFKLELNEADKKDELIDAVLKAAREAK